jgi:hypothetical protein
VALNQRVLTLCTSHCGTEHKGLLLYCNQGTPQELLLAQSFAKNMGL